MAAGTILLTYLIGAIFAVAGVIFMVGLEENRFLFGIPYLLIGLVMLYGVYGVQRRRRKRGEDPRRTGH
jgi:drug/metabolite transporter (DMT)-like permease